MNREETGPSGDFFFAGFRFDRANDELLRLSRTGDAVPVAIGSRGRALLGILVDRRGCLVAKDEIMDAVWPGLTVEEANLTVQVAALRRILDRDRVGASSIQTVRGRGYRFVATVTGPEHPDPPASTETPPFPDKPSVAVLPFINISGDPVQEYFADGMVEEIITALSRIRWLFVIASNSSFTYKGRAIDVQRVGRELGVRYVVEGSVRKAGGRVRIAAQLIEARTSVHLWADHFDGSLEDVFDLQDKVAQSIAGIIEPALQAAETVRATSRPTTNLTAYDAFLRANAALPTSAKEISRSTRLLEQAIARDHCYAPALALAAMCYLRLVSDGFSKHPEADRRKGIAYARKALQTAGDDAVALANGSFALACFGQDIEAMMLVVDRALAFNPSYARGWYISAFLRLQAGQPDLAIEHAEKAERLSPRSWTGSPPFIIGAALFVSRRFAAAVPKLLLAIQNSPSFPVPYQYLAACYAHLGRREQASEVIAQLRTITALVLPTRSVLRNPEHRELLLSGLRLATGETA